MGWQRSSFHIGRLPPVGFAPRTYGGERSQAAIQESRPSRRIPRPRLPAPCGTGPEAVCTCATGSGWRSTSRCARAGPGRPGSRRPSPLGILSPSSGSLCWIWTTPWPQSLARPGARGACWWLRRLRPGPYAGRGSPGRRHRVQHEPATGHWRRAPAGAPQGPTPRGAGRLPGRAERGAPLRRDGAALKLSRNPGRSIQSRQGTGTQLRRGKWSL